MSELGLSSSDEEDDLEKPVPPPDSQTRVSSSNIDNDLGLSSSDEDEDEQVMPLDTQSKPEVPSEPKGPAELEKFTYMIPKLPVANKTATVHMTRLPNILGFRKEEFTRESFTQSEDGQSFTRNLMMWRYKKDASGNIVEDEEQKPIRESNSRLVKWSDGSMQLYVGHEVFEVAVLPAEHSYLFVKQTPEGNTTILEAQNEVANRLQFQPSSLTSDAHMKLTTRVRLESQKTARIRELAVVTDPERVKAERERLERMKRKKNSTDRRKPPSRPGMAHHPRPGMDRSYIEYDQDNITAIKNSYLEGSIGNDSDSNSIVTSDSDSPVEEPVQHEVRSANGADSESDSGEEDVVMRKRPRHNQFGDDDE